MLIICHACQAQVSDDGAVCPQCGAPKKALAGPIAHDQFPPPGTPGWGWWFLGAVVLVGWAMMKAFVK